MQTFSFPLASFANNYFSFSNFSPTRMVSFSLFLLNVARPYARLFRLSHHLSSSPRMLQLFLLIGFVIYYLWHENSRLTAGQAGQVRTCIRAMKVYDNAIQRPGPLATPSHRWGRPPVCLLDKKQKILKHHWKDLFKWLYFIFSF